MSEIIILSSLADEIDELVQQTIKKAVSVKKYGGTLYTLNPDEKEGQFCGLFLYKEHVQLVFRQGALLDDATNVLRGNGKLRRHINFTHASELDSQLIVKLVKQAAKLSDQRHEW